MCNAARIVAVLRHFFMMMIRCLHWLRTVFALIACCVVVPRVGAGAFDGEIAAFESADAVNPPPANVIPFVGSSSFNNWANLPAAFPNHPVLNRGFGGSQMSDVLEYFDRVVARYQPPLVVVYEGDNDLAAGKSVAQVFADYSNFVWRVQQQLPATDIAFLSVKPSPSRASLLGQMAQLNSLIAGLADGRRIRYIDIYTPMLDGTGQPRAELFGPDNLHMNAAGYALWQSIIGPALDAWASTVGGTFLFDFGAAANTTEHAAAPDDPLNYWNNVTDAIGASPAGQVSNLVTVENSQTAMSLVIQSRFNGANANGTTAYLLFPPEAIRDSLFGNTEIFNGQSNLFPSFRLMGLDTQSVYHFTFFASRTNVSDNRETRYTVTGGSIASAVLNAANNTTNVAIVGGMAPDAAGQITIDLSPTENNNSANHFTYLGVMRMDAVPPQRPISFLREPVNTRVSVTRPASFSVAIAGSSPFFIQWFSNGMAIPGANQLTYTVPSATLDMSGALFSVSISNLAYSVMSSNALLEVTDAPPPLEVTTQVVLFDFGGGNTTEHAASPDDPTNYWNNVTTVIGSSSTALLTNIVTTENVSTVIGLAMLGRFNGANENGTTTSAVFPVEATRDSLFGNTEVFSGLSNIFPKFKLTGLDGSRRYRLTFYASRTGVGDNRETLYTVVGAATNSAVLNAANNISNVAALNETRPTAEGELVISLAPGSNNNNANHFTYLGVLKVELLPLPRYLPPQFSGGNFILRWTGSAEVESAPTVLGPWTSVSGIGENSHAEPINLNTNRFFRLRVSE